jgi:hypothetical protein
MFADSRAKLPRGVGTHAGGRREGGDRGHRRNRAEIDVARSRSLGAASSACPAPGRRRQPAPGADPCRVDREGQRDKRGPRGGLGGSARTRDQLASRWTGPPPDVRGPRRARGARGKVARPLAVLHRIVLLRRPGHQLAVELAERRGPLLSDAGDARNSSSSRRPAAAARSSQSG